MYAQGLIGFPADPLKGVYEHKPNDFCTSDYNLSTAATTSKIATTNEQ